MKEGCGGVFFPGAGDGAGPRGAESSTETSHSPSARSSHCSLGSIYFKVKYISYADSVVYIGQQVLRLFTIEETPPFTPAGASLLVTYLLHHPYCRHHGLKRVSTIYRASLAFPPSFSLLHQEPPAATKNSTRICRHSHLALQRRMGETRFCTTRGKNCAFHVFPLLLSV